MIKNLKIHKILLSNKENYNKINIINIENENEGKQYNKNNTSSSIKKKAIR